MKKIVSTMLAGVLAAATLVPAAPAFAQNRDRGDWCKFGNCDRDRGNDRYSKRDNDHDWDWDGKKRYSWNRDWDDNRRYRYRDRDDFDGGAALIFGLAAGAIASGIASSAHGGYYGGSYERCAATYRSFNPQTWTYLGYDGYYHRCPY
jgi:hypothetical protein